MPFRYCEIFEQDGASYKFLNAVDSFLCSLCCWLLVVRPVAGMRILAPRSAMQQGRQSLITLSNRTQFYVASGSALRMLSEQVAHLSIEALGRFNIDSRSLLN